MDCPGTRISFRQTTRAALAAALFAGLGACGNRTPLQAPEPIEVAGEATWPADRVLPPNCTFAAEISDASASPPGVIATRTFTGLQAPPFVFSFLVRSSDVDPSRAYSLTLQIVDPGGKTLFAAPPQPVLVEGMPTRDLAIVLLENP